MKPGETFKHPNGKTYEAKIDTHDQNGGCRNCACYTDPGCIESALDCIIYDLIFKEVEPQKLKPMTADEMTDMIIKDLLRRNFPVFLPKFSGRGIDEADVFGINRNGYMYEFEIKRSRADFLADFRNKIDKHRRLKNRDAVVVYDEWKNGRKTGNKTTHIVIPNRFYFVCEAGLLNNDDIPEYAGLAYIHHGKFIEQKQAPLLHKEKANLLIYERVATILSQRIIFGCSYYTFKNKN